MSVKPVSTRIACWQTRGHHDVDITLTRLREAADAAASAGAKLLVTPEMSLTGYHLDRRRIQDLAEPCGGPLCQAVAGIAEQSGIAVVFGWPEAESEAVYNSVQLVDRHGQALATYRKTHLYGDIDRRAFTPGQHGVTQAELDGLTVGLLICYDVEFPETVRAHALAGTELLLVPTALMRTWEFVAEVLVPARAFESQLFVAYTNWIGREGGLTYCGRSRVVGPDGGLLALAADAEQLLLADLDHGAIAAARAATPYLRDRRPELFPTAGVSA